MSAHQNDSPSVLGALTPLDVLAAWPPEEPLLMLCSGREHPRWGRRSIIARPDPASWLRIDESDGPSALAVMNAALGATGAPGARGGWIGFLSYDLGRFIEPAADGGFRGMPDRAWPLIELAHCPDALIYDHDAQRWHVEGEADVRSALRPHPFAERTGEPLWRAGLLRSAGSPDAHLSAVARAIEYIGQGDIFQANITQRFTAGFRGSARALAAAALTASEPLYGAYLELPGGRSIISMSPELFLDVRHDSPSQHLAVSPSRRCVATRPIKGTRAASRDPRELRDSAKDAAELHMIVDLMRNDLGRVCEYGSVRVAQPRAIESYGGGGAGVHHGVAEIGGILRENVTLGDLLAATFPAGSITGAPKIRAMQIIDELEHAVQPSARRGPYCGAIGWIGDDGEACLNVAIRTIALTGSRACGRWDAYEDALLDYGAGGGIVADSDPAEEYREMLDKTAILRAVLSIGADQVPIQHDDWACGLR